MSAGAPVPAMSLGLDLEVLLLPHPFSRFLHVLTGALGDRARASPCSRGWRPPPLTATRCRWSRCSPRPAAWSPGSPNGPSGPPAGASSPTPSRPFSFWGRGLHGYLAAALIEQGRYDEGLAALDVAIDRFLEAGGRTGVVVYKAARAVALAGSGRLDAAADAVAAAYKELETYRERFAEPLVLEADARYRQAAGDEETAADLLRRAVTMARAQGALGIARRIATTADRLGVALDD